jgi:hypothetical protein
MNEQAYANSMMNGGTGNRLNVFYEYMYFIEEANGGYATCSPWRHPERTFVVFCTA